ncbi:hypothetical protein PCC7418_1254 [Halothece sp. PCC 7418]|uniref:hypothetical protein n=1 Tax=Halothece sp. (strain PCC 7418) TaxID=65093 RepID=UPI0002A08675|nr:hypothetical protein [Halothece sp. PCC 7418]AFZ43454.1 hypothetical protein PCC7418_1254 [Halothece sp. PCC 7418]
MLSIRRLLSLFFVLTIFLVTPACSKNEPPSRFESAQQESVASDSGAVTEDAVKGGELNRYFPENQDGYQVIYTQEKRGFAQAKLKQNGEELALMSISDLANNPTAAKKFQDSEETIKSYPLVTQGRKATAVLVNNRYQVKIVSRSDIFDQDSRQEWLQKFDLDTLAQL